jgi:4-hydroxy-2-oxoheptanedioate aldolase
MFRENSLRKKLQSGQKALGCWLALGNAATAEIAGLAGYDWVMIDHEHGPGDFQSAIAQMQALAAFETTSLLRVPWNDPVYIKRALDAGAEGIMVPMVETADEARAAVAACRYPPNGIRGAATSSVRAADYGLAEADYVAGAEAQLMIICQIETLTGIENIEAIAAVEGVDMLFVGPSDISTNLGYAKQRDHPKVKEVLAEVEKRIKDAGKWMGTVLRFGLDPQDLFDAGYDIVSGGSDSNHVRNAAVAQVKAHREKNP